MTFEMAWLALFTPIQEAVTQKTINLTRYIMKKNESNLLITIQTKFQFLTT